MSFWNPFRRNPTPPQSPSEPDDHRQMSEDWAPGDLAECIDDSFAIPPGIVSPKKGDVLRVRSVHEGVDCLFGIPLFVLTFEGRGHIGWDNRCFRKLRPTNEPAEQSWTEWFKDKLRQPEVVP